MRMQRFAWTAVVTLAIVAAVGQTASAQVFVAPAPVVSYYYAPAPPVVSFYSPPTVGYYTAPAVSFQAPVVSAIPTQVLVPASPIVSYYSPVAVPAVVSRGLFGRTIVRTPFAKFKY